MIEKLIKSIDLFNGRIVHLKRNLVELPNKEIAFREIVIHSEGVCIIPVINDEIIFVKQFRSGINKTLLELPAGLVDKGEKPVDAAIRELQEEIGYTSNKITPLGSFYSSPGFTNELVHLYLAEDLNVSHLPKDDDEFIEVFSYNIKKVKYFLENNQLNDMKTALAISRYFNMQKN